MLLASLAFAVVQAQRSARTGSQKSLLETVHMDPGRQHDMQRILSCLHFIRTALLDKDTPFHSR
jgi:hypothetical protein